MTRRRIGAARRARRGGTAGSAAIEFGLFMPLFVILLTGVVELGFAMFGSMQVYNAAGAGIAYAAKNGWSSAGISAAIVNSSGITGIEATPAPTQFCGCPTLAGVAVAACNATCTGGTPVGRYIRINASLPRTSILTSSFGLPATLTAQSIYREQ